MTEELLARGWQALADGRWHDARQAFEKATATGPQAAAWEGLSWATYWAGDVDGTFAARERAYTFHREAGDQLGAARAAIWLGSDSLDFRGEEAVAQGW